MGKLHAAVSVELSVLSPMQREMKNLALTHCLSQNPTAKSRSQQNCRKLERLTIRKTEWENACKI